MTMGEFAELTRLSPKALRLYDRLGLLVPERVDAGTGYRRYARDQVEAARLVGLLRRLDMPPGGHRHGAGGRPEPCARSCRRSAQRRSRHPGLRPHRPPQVMTGSDRRAAARPGRQLIAPPTTIGPSHAHRHLRITRADERNGFRMRH
jgi:MerR HTH family regulatory protein